MQSSTHSATGNGGGLRRTGDRMPHLKTICRSSVAGSFICTFIHTHMNTETHANYADETKYNRLTSKMSSKIKLIKQYYPL